VIRIRNDRLDRHEEAQEATALHGCIPYILFSMSSGRVAALVQCFSCRRLIRTISALAASTSPGHMPCRVHETGIFKL